MFTRLFWKDTLERVVASAAGGVLTLLALDGADVLDGVDDVKAWFVVVGVPALTSLAKALVATRVNDSVSPASLAKVHPPEQPAYTPEGN